jgi:hypothetical protein
MAMAGGYALWASEGGGGLLRMDTLKEGSMVADSETSLLMISGVGSDTRIRLSEAAAPFDFESIKTQEDMQRFNEYRDQNQSESIETLNARPRRDGGFDVLFQRESGSGDRQGYFLLQIGPGGDILSETSLGNVLSDHGLDKWVDFYIEGEQLILLGRVMVTQHGVQAKRKKYMQNLVSQVPLNGGAPVSRLIPLDKRYLEAAMNAGDAEIQYLDGLPGGDPVLLTTLGGKPLDVSVGWIAKRQVLRLNEATEQLMVYTEAYEEKQAKLAKEESRKQRKAEREARKQQMNADMAAAVGMTPEEYAALSNRERKEAMVRHGDLDAMQAAAEKQASAAQQGLSTQQPVVPQDMNAQLAAAMAQAQEQMANDPNMTPEMRAQMAALMAQISQGAGGQTTAPPTIPAKQPQAAPVQSTSGGTTSLEKSLKVDSEKRGFIEYENKDGRLITLLIFNRKTGEELLKKDYPDGVIYEYVDFSRFGLPLEQIGVIYREVAGMILEDLTPVIQP